MQEPRVPGTGTKGTAGTAPHPSQALGTCHPTGAVAVGRCAHPCCAGASSLPSP